MGAILSVLVLLLEEWVDPGMGRHQQNCRPEYLQSVCFQDRFLPKQKIHSRLIQMVSLYPRVKVW